MDSIHYIDSDEFKKLDEKVFDIMISCKTIPQFESCIKYIDLMVDMMLDRAVSQHDKIRITMHGSFRRGFAYGMIQGLREKQDKDSVETYLSLGV